MRFPFLLAVLPCLVVFFVVGCGAPAPTTVNEEGSRVDPAIDPAFYEQSETLDPLAPAK
jgi:hypothetical protein